ncbi:Signal transduction histidine kinase, glucose-6-phosphate specific [Dyella jiangningensis]|uniref:MASE1 domain-containing protein n=1 Tax=Dyella sp. AtDHG13 TaxID=1938897 RepID=UPI00089136E5|nr:MASE1 domain-containing protein [Dyella sp. AtDHG13]PXV54629.1 glucose-6-phosphate-specific signal transduction histidine kinase [Dyella sp. AtDHG13]SDK90503.1 Signal transduction histidine kinase, glucose-6-phosphate specific [Dyella jiangningensis]
MLDAPWANPWFRRIGLAVSYGLLIYLVRQVAITHFVLLTGVHLTVLLLTRYRDWPLLVAGEMAVLVPITIQCIDQWGWGIPWGIFNVIPAIVIMAPVVWLVRERWPIMTSRYSLNMGALLGCALVLSFLMTGYNIASMMVMHLPPGYVAHFDKLGVEWVLGNYLGILAVTPTVLFAHQLFKGAYWRELGGRLLDNRVVLDSIFLVIPALLLLVWIGLESAHVRQIAQVAMFLPIVWLAMRHGWQGAAIGGTAASLAVMALMPATYDQQTMQAEAIVAFAISSMLLLGARIGALNQHAEQERMDVRMALALAQRNVHIGEMQLRTTSLALEQIRETVQASFAMMMSRIRHLQPTIEDRSYHRQALVAQDQLFRLADSLYPVSWRERGLPAALREGAIPRALDETGVGYWCDLRGPLSRLSQTLHLAIYRLVVEVVADACAKRNVSEIVVRIRCGEKGGRRWALVSIILRGQAEAASHVRWDELLPRVMRSTSGMGWSGIRDRAMTFEGDAREHALANGRRVSLLLLDPITISGV